MPSNPFGGIGSKGDEKQIAEQTRALRAYEQARKRLISSMKGEERAVAGLAAAHSAAMQTRSRDAASYERELTRTSGLLASQGVALKNLDATRERFHREEMDRSQSLLQRYEGIKQALREIQEDSDDTSTLLGGFVRPLKDGIDNMLKFGNLPKITQPIRDTAIDFDDVTGSIKRSAGAVQDLGGTMHDAGASVWKYRSAMVDLDADLKGLKVKYADASDGTQKLANQFILLSKTDMVAPGAIKDVTAVTDSLKFLEAQGVATETAMALVVERARKSGRTFQDSASDVEQITAQADILRESLSGTDTVLQGFAFTVRDDFVRAIADATRNLDSQVVSIENVSAAYAYAAKKAAEYGLSAEGTEKVSKAFAGSFFKERQDAVGILSGQELQAQLSKGLADAEKAIGVAYADASDQKKKELEDMAYGTMGITATDENRLSLKQGISTLGEGLGAVDLRNLLAGTTAAIKSDLDAQMNKLNIASIDDTSVASRLLASINGFEDLTTSQKRFVSDVLMKEGSGSAAEEIARLQEEAMKKAEETKDLTSSALTTVLTLKDPIQQLFNIKDFLKSIMMNISNIVKLVSKIPGLGGATGLFEDTTGASLQKDYASAAVAASMQASGDERKKLIEDFAAAQRDLIGAKTDGARDRRRADLERIAAALEENTKKQGELESIRKEYERVTGGSLPSSQRADAGERESHIAALGSLASSGFSTLGETLTDTFGGLFDSSEEGRVAGVDMARRSATETPARRDARGAYDRAQAQRTNGAAGEMEAAGSGEVTVDASGESVMVVRMRIKNMGEVIAHHNSTEARVLDQFGLGSG